MENIELGLLLMVVGMVTVFVILLIVIWLSQLPVQWMPLRRLWIF